MFAENQPASREVGDVSPAPAHSQAKKKSRELAQRCNQCGFSATRHVGNTFIVLRMTQRRPLNSIQPHPMQCRSPPLQIEDAIGAPRIPVTRV